MIILNEANIIYQQSVYNSIWSVSSITRLFRLKTINRTSGKNFSKFDISSDCKCIVHRRAKLYNWCKLKQAPFPYSGRCQVDNYILVFSTETYPYLY